MKKNLLDPQVKEEVLSRINKLNKDTKSEWGKMNLNQMLFHTAAGLRIGYGEIKTAPRGNWMVKQLMRFVIFKTDMPTPKEKAETFPEINTVSLGINPADFEEERKKLFELVKKFPAKDLQPTSGLLGKMSKDNWSRLHYTHLDHHLKQFGV